ncbi:MAG: SDR family oxidoreductase [Luminiphilus sp.]|nr:SDR family oxidoreductase [Luminiphilus sp.]
MAEFAGRVVVVTGGAGHIGRAICEAFLAEGAEVIAVGRREPKTAIIAGGREASFFPADIRDPGASQALIDHVTSTHRRIDILVNNAGGGPPVAAADASPELTQKIIALNLTAPVILSQQAHPALMASEQVASVINIASVSGARPSPGTAAYGAAKAGLLNVTKSLAMEWGPDIRVNALIVGLVHNDAGVEHYGGEAGFQRVADMLPLKRMAAPTDIANTVLMLCSDRSSYISGANLEVDGGGEVPVFLHLASEQSTTK